MIVLDTNVVLRYLIKDDRAQAQRATQFLQHHRCLLLPTVLLETVWVMGSKRGYALERSCVAERLRHIAGLPTVTVEKAHSVSQAIDWYEAGMDFADALHLALADHRGFATFDQDVGRFVDDHNLPFPGSKGVRSLLML